MPISPIKSDGIFFQNEPQALQSNEISDYRLPFLRTLNDFTTFEVSAVVPGANAATASLYPIFYVANVRCFLIEAKLRHDVNTTSGTVDIEKIVNGTAKGSGVSMIRSTFDTSTGARTTMSRKPTLTLANAQLSPSDAIALRTTGTLTNGSDIVVTCLFGIHMKDLPISTNL